MKKKKWLVAGAALLAFCAGTAAFLYDQGNRIETTQLLVTSAAFPAAFSDFRLVQISDLHGKCFGKNQARLLEQIRTAQPDIIVLTGDIVDERTTHLDSTREFLTQAAALAPVYAVSGNHDSRSPCRTEYAVLLAELGVINLDGRYVRLTREDTSITLGGDGWGEPGGIWLPQAAGEPLLRAADNTAPDILLCHSPDHWLDNAGQGSALLLAGHMHGGQVALPGGRAIFAPGEGGIVWNPAYASGRFEQNGTVLYVSRGLGTSVLPVRLFARPEVVAVRLTMED